jgi:hypothetical protein
VDGDADCFICRKHAGQEAPHWPSQDGGNAEDRERAKHETDHYSSCLYPFNGNRHT